MRHISVKSSDLTAEAVGEVEKDDKVLVLRRIHVRYRLRGADVDREKVERVNDAHVRACPVARSLEGGIDITTVVDYAG